MAPSGSPPQLLIVEDDLGLQSVLQLVLADQGYGAHVASSVEQALRLVHHRSFDLILTELFTPKDQETLTHLLPLRALAEGIPIIVLATLITAREAQQQRFDCVLSMPFGLDELITTVAECINQPFDAEQLRLAEVVKRWFAALEQGDRETIMALSVEDVQHYPWIVPVNPTERPSSGRADLWTQIEGMRDYLRDFSLEIMRLSPCPHGIAARLLIRWHASAGTFHQQMACACFRGSDQQVRQIGVPVQDERLRKFLER